MNDRRATDDRQAMSAAPGHLNSPPDMLATAIVVPPNGRIVVIRLDNIGDVVMTLPLVRELKRRFAGAAIDVVVSPVAADLFRHCPYTGGVIPLLSRRLPRFDVIDQLRRSRRLYREWFAASRPDLAISPRFGPEPGGAAIAAFASRARYRLAYHKPRILPPVSAWLHDDFFTHFLSPGPVEHEVVKNLAFARALGAGDILDRLEFWLSEGERLRARELLLQVGRARMSASLRWRPAPMSPIIVGRLIVSRWSRGRCDAGRRAVGLGGASHGRAPHAEGLRGPDLMPTICERSPARGYRHFFYGGAPGVTYAQPYRALSAEEDAAVVRLINGSGVDIAWVGLSTPKQERWMADHLGRIQAPVMLGVGAAFDVHAGAVRRAPRPAQTSSAAASAKPPAKTASRRKRTRSSPVSRS